jgi:TonB family protein
MQLLFALAMLVSPFVVPQLPDASTVLAQQAAAMQKHNTLQYTNETTIDVGAPNTSLKLTMKTSAYRQNPGKTRVETESTIVPGFTMVSDGEWTWMYNPSSKQYTKTGAALGPVAVMSSMLPPGMVDLSAISNMTSSLTKAAKVVREENIDVEGKVHPCWVLQMNLDNVPVPTANATLGMIITLWIDKELGLNIQTDISSKGQTPTTAPASMQLSIHQKTIGLKVDEPIDSSLFTFVPPADAKEVTTLSLPGASRVDLSGKQAPAFEVKALDGTPYSLSSLKGKTVLLDFWASWCAPCRAAMPALEALNSKYKDRGLVILGIDVGENRQTVEAFLKSTPFSYPAILGTESEIANLFQVTGYPTFVLIDPSGKIVANQMGYSSEAALNLMLSRSGLAGAAIQLALPPADIQRVGAGVSPPRVIRRVEPQYTDLARANRIQGSVVLEAVITEDGTARIVRIARSLGYGLDESAVTALQQWTFAPGMKDGKPVNVALNIVVNFNLRDDVPGQK